MDEPDLDLWKRAERARDQLVQQFIWLPGVNMVDLGYDDPEETGAEKTGGEDRPLVVRVHLHRSADQKKLGIPGDVDGIPVRVIIESYQPNRWKGGEMEREQEPMMTESGPRADFQRIKGIGSSMARALHEIGILSFQDLADQTPGQLAERLKNQVSFISAQRIERDRWIEQARALTEAEPPLESLGTDFEGVGNAPEPEQGSPEETADRSTWREIADYFVSFGYSVDSEGREVLQTKAHHSQTAEEYVWEGIDTDQLVEWMLQRAQLSSPKRTAADTPLVEQAPAAEEPEVSIELADLWVTEVAAVTPGGQTTGRQLRARSKLNLAGGQSMSVTERKSPYAIEVHLVDITTNQSSLVANSSDQFIPGVFSYDILSDFRIPPAGNYQLYLFARLLPPWTNTAYAQGPVIQVTPP